MFTMFFFSEWIKNVTGSRGKSSETLGSCIFSSGPTQAFTSGMQVKLSSSHSLFPECLLNSTLSTYLLFSMIILPGLHTGRNTNNQSFFCGVLKRVRLSHYVTLDATPAADHHLLTTDWLLLTVCLYHLGLSHTVTCKCEAHTAHVRHTHCPCETHTIRVRHIQPM